MGPLDAQAPAEAVLLYTIDKALAAGHEPIADALLELLTCRHPAERRTLGTCGACGAILDGDGWHVPKLVTAVLAALDSARP